MMNRERRRAQAKAVRKAAIPASSPAGTAAQMLNTAIAHHQSGRLVEAEALYRRILAADARNADALHLLGVIAHQVKRNDIAVDLIGKAISINGTVPAYYSNRGSALRALGRLEEALASYEAALRLRPDLAEACYNRGTVLQELGRLEEAVTAYDAALRIKPDYAEAHSNRGNALKAIGRFEEALISYDVALRIKPDYAEAHSNRGNALKALGRLEEALAAYEAALRIGPDLAEAHSNRGAALRGLGRLEEALASYDAALQIKPDYAEAYYNLGNTLKDLNCLEKALAAYEAALRLKPDYAQAHSNRGVVLKALGRFEEAVVSYDVALRIKPDYAEAHSNRGVALQELDRLEESLAAYEAALRIRPDYADAYYNRGNALRALGRLEEALAAYDTALRIDPDHAEAHTNRAAALLLASRLAEGWREYEWRWLKKKLPHDTFPRWQGEPADGRTLLVWWEQGLGDIIQFARYLPLLRQRGWRVIFEVPSLLARLLDGLADATVVAQGDPLPPFDLQCPLLSLPLGFGTTLETIPAAVPYVYAEPERRTFWRQRLPKDGFRIGIVWQGNPGHSNDRHRSIPLKQFAPLSALSGVRLVGLQKNHGLDQLAGLPEGMTVQTLGAEYDEGGFPDTAALIMELDLIVSADTSVAHLAGALGRPVWVALPMAPDWRWMLQRADSPWYPSMRLFRQPERGDWDSVFHEIARAARTVNATPR